MANVKLSPIHVSSETREKPVQLELQARTWGGKREGAGRPKTGKKYVPHRVRPEHKRDHPVHVTLRAHVSELRDFPVFDVVAAALAKGSKSFFRVCEYSVQRNHIHLIVEADHTDSLSRGMQGLVARLAKAVNRAMRRKGSVFADHYHAHELRRRCGCSSSDGAGAVSSRRARYRVRSSCSINSTGQQSELLPRIASFNIAPVREYGGS